MIQLNPMLPFWHIASRQPCYAFMAIDYSQEHDLLFTVVLQNGEIWTCRAAELRGQENMTLGRPKSAVNDKPDWFESAGGSGKAAQNKAAREASSVSAMQNPSEGHYVE